MNKNILLIFVMIMALLLIGISCSNDTTKPNNSGTGSGTNNNTTNVTVTTNSLQTAVLAGLGGSLEIKNGGSSIKLSTNNTVVTVYPNNIVVTITDTTINSKQAGEIEDTRASIEKVLDNLKAEMEKVGVNITSTNAAGWACSHSYPSLNFTLNASKIPDTETIKYELPEGITDLQRVIIIINLGGNASWTWEGTDYPPAS